MNKDGRITPPRSGSESGEALAVDGAAGERARRGGRAEGEQEVASRSHVDAQYRLNMNHHEVYRCRTGRQLFSRLRFGLGLHDFGVAVRMKGAFYSASASFS